MEAVPGFRPSDQTTSVSRRGSGSAPAGPPISREERTHEVMEDATMPSITADDVIWAYRAFLRRDPESTDVITRWVDGGGTLRDLVDLLLQSEEFAAVYSPAN